MATYRVGNHQPQNLYRDDTYIGVMFAAEDAALVVEALNGAEPRYEIRFDGGDLTSEQMDEFRAAFRRALVVEKPAFRAEPAVICPSCSHAAYMHRERDRQQQPSCIGTGPGFACTCTRTCEGLNEALGRSQP